MSHDVSRRRWSDAVKTLLRLGRADVDAVGVPAPTLLAYDGDGGVAFVELRPFGDDATSALVEVLSLLLPLGVDRLALSLPGRAWSLEDPIVPVSDDVDLRTPVLVVVTADGHDGPCRTSLELHPFDTGADGTSWGNPVRPDESIVCGVDHVLRVLLDGRDALEVDDLRLAAQLGRVLLLGHQLALAPDLVHRLTAASTRCPPPAAGVPSTTSRAEGRAWPTRSR